MASNLIAWDAVNKLYLPAHGDTNAPFTFNLTNVSPENIVIYATDTSCDCTVAKLPATPWTLLPGGHGQIQADIDLRGKTGTSTNWVVVFTSKGNKLLQMKTVIPPPLKGPLPSQRN